LLPFASSTVFASSLFLAVVLSFALGVDKSKSKMSEERLRSGMSSVIGSERKVSERKRSSDGDRRRDAPRLLASFRHHHFVVRRCICSGATVGKGGAQ